MENRSKQLASRMRNRMNDQDPYGLYAHMEFTFNRSPEWVRNRASRYISLLQKLGESGRGRNSQVRRVAVKTAATIAYTDISDEAKETLIRALMR